MQVIDEVVGMGHKVYSASNHQRTCELLNKPINLILAVILHQVCMKRGIGIFGKETIKVNLNGES